MRDVRHFRKRLEVEPADEIEQRLVLGTHAGQLHVLRAKPTQEERPQRIEAAQAADIERGGLAPLHALPERAARLAQGADVEHALERQMAALAIQCEGGGGRIRGVLRHGAGETLNGAEGFAFRALV